ncbi:hypothetical protein WL1483_112 [Aeromonas schubertii]|uniref:Uncharacterized protein n=1 Tax=Aeromonas schubertii TaxID=652 RepID=A0A0S2SCV2_9GAMM|nr:hypothetical protein WL1483_112 [Aeromonas schubertii]
MASSSPTQLQPLMGAALHLQTKPGEALAHLPHVTLQGSTAQVPGIGQFIQFDPPLGTEQQNHQVNDPLATGARQCQLLIEPSLQSLEARRIEPGKLVALAP